MLSHVRFFVTPWTGARQASLSMKFFWQKCWSGLPFPRGSSPPINGTDVSCVSCIVGRFFTREPLGKPPIISISILIIRLPWWLRGKESACKAGRNQTWVGKREGNGSPLQYSGLENSMRLHISVPHFVPLILSGNGYHAYNFVTKTP